MPFRGEVDGSPVVDGSSLVYGARAGGATVVAAYSPRIRPDTPVSFPVSWDELDRVTPSDFTIHTVPALLRGGNPWADHLPEPQSLPESKHREQHGHDQIVGITIISSWPGAVIWTARIVGSPRDCGGAMVSDPGLGVLSPSGAARIRAKRLSAGGT